MLTDQSVGKPGESRRFRKHVETSQRRVTLSSSLSIHEMLTLELPRTRAGSVLPTVLTYTLCFLGHCLKGPLCPYIHNPTTVAICKEYLQKGTCPAGQSCDLSHDPTPERTPACLHFLRGKCSNPTCRYAHIRVNPSAPVCKDFAIYGYCTKGRLCNERHVHECPSYANIGACRDKKCRLPHVDRAGQIRKRAANAAGISNEGDPLSPAVIEDDLTSEEEDSNSTTSDDVDSDGLEEEILHVSNGLDAHALSQQQDYVQF